MNNLHGLIPPHDQELEEVILGAILLQSDTLSSLSGTLIPEIFYVPSNRLIFDSILKLKNENAAIDILTVTKKLRAEGVLEAAGGPMKVSGLTNRVSGTAHLSEWWLILREHWMRREFGNIAQRVFNRSYDKSEDAFDIYDEFSKAMNAIHSGSNDGEVQHIKAAIDRAREMVEARLNNPDGVSGIPSSLNCVNRLLGGYAKTDLIILGARPGMGKSAYAAGEALHAAMLGHRVLVFSLEMSREQWVYRWNSMVSQVDVEKLAKYRLDETRLSQFYAGNDVLNGLPIWIDDTSGVTAQKIMDKASRAKKKHGVDFILIDYLQLISGGNNRRNGNREQELSEISRTLKLMAKELDVPVLALSQLSRALESRADKRPLLSDLRESGAIEQDADVVCFLFRPSYYGAADGQPDELIVAKQRNGSTGIVPVKFLGEQTKYVDISTSYSPF
jgi:replicative DNA helicase